MYNFNRADWPNIKSDLDCVDWESELGSNEPDISWMNFKTILSKITTNMYQRLISKRNLNHPGLTLNVFKSANKRRNYTENSKIINVQKLK